MGLSASRRRPPVKVATLLPSESAMTCPILGQHGAGKSTIFRQLSAAFGSPVPFRSDAGAIQKHMLKSLQVFLRSAAAAGLHPSTEQGRAAAALVAAVPDAAQPLQCISQSVAAIWSDPAVRAALSVVRATGLTGDIPECLCNLPHFLGEIERISLPSYSPTPQDVIKWHDESKFIKVTDLESVGSEGRRFLLYDMCGQRWERRKWASVSHGAGCVLFVVALTEYCEALLECEPDNRLDESVVLIEDLAHSRWFTHVPIVLLLTKFDLLPSYLECKPLSDKFPEYRGGADAESAAAFLAAQLQAAASRESSLVFLTPTARGLRSLRDMCVSKAAQRAQLDCTRLPLHLQAEIREKGFPQPAASGNERKQAMHTFVVNAVDPECMKRLSGELEAILEIQA